MMLQLLLNQIISLQYFQGSDQSRKAAISFSSRRERGYSRENEPSEGEMNVMLSSAKTSRGLNNTSKMFQSTESIPPSDIFVRKECSAVTITQNGKFGSMPQASTDRNVSVFNKINQNGTGIVSSGTIVTRTRIMNSSSAVSRQSSNLTDATGRTSRSTKKFIANRQIKSQKEAWFSCIKKGSCGNSRKDRSPERGGPMDEALLIEKAFVVEMLIQFWADKYQPASLKRFICHKQQALQLNHLGSAFQIDFNHLLKDFCGDCFRHRKQVLAT
ncbi:hypothetical protein FXO38_30117 [Capsicum annuum]|nr:hypothetical protein FXO38_30117 [Capsicum annuum]KAF3626044.1 hypothetical protein FXO37_30551 [Capsicum annuum]